MLSAQSERVLETTPDHRGSTVGRVPEAPTSRGELHLHLNGAIPVETVLEILAEENPDIASRNDVRTKLIRAAPSVNLKEYLEPWKILRSIPRRKSSLLRMCDAMMTDLAANEVRFVEIRNTVIYLAGLMDCAVADALGILIEATGNAAKQHGIRRGLELTVNRGEDSAAHLSQLLEAYRILGCPSDVVGLDLAGDEEQPYASELPRLFRSAKDRFGLGITIHAGETGRSENIYTALRDFDADRIGHGTAAGKDPHLLDLLANEDTCVEVCPISNRLTGALGPAETHPLVAFRNHGVPIVICSDNPGIHQRGLQEDYEAAVREGFPRGELLAQFATAKKYSFIEELC